LSHGIHYADDTLLVSVSNSLFVAIMNINIQIARVTRHIGKLGLKIAEAKTEAVLLQEKAEGCALGKSR